MDALSGMVYADLKMAHIFTSAERFRDFIRQERQHFILRYSKPATFGQEVSK